MQPASGWCGPVPGQLGAGFFVPKTPHEKKIRFRKKKCLHGQRAGYGDPVAASNANQPTTEMQTTTAPIAIGTKKYSVGITATRRWESANGIVREYLTIGKPGITEVRSAYIATTPAAPSAYEVAVETAIGQIIWSPTAGTSSAKRDAINAWFRAIAESMAVAA